MMSTVLLALGCGHVETKEGVEYTGSGTVATLKRSSDDKQDEKTLRKSSDDYSIRIVARRQDGNVEALQVKNSRMGRPFARKAGRNIVLSIPVGVEIVVSEDMYNKNTVFGKWEAYEELVHLEDKESTWSYLVVARRNPAGGVIWDIPKGVAAKDTIFELKTYIIIKGRPSGRYEYFVELGTTEIKKAVAFEYELSSNGIDNAQLHVIDSGVMTGGLNSNSGRGQKRKVPW
jgi:hypothetical protein